MHDEIHLHLHLNCSCGLVSATPSCYTAARSVNVDSQQVGNISHIRLVIEGIMVRSLHSNEQFSDGLRGQLAGLTLGEREHCALHEVELLLEVIKANACVYLVPVEDLGLVWQLGVGTVGHALQAAVDVLVVENVEQLLEKETVAKVHREVLYFPATSHCKNPV